MSKFYITTPLYYVNSSPHIGHAYTNIIGDCVARFKRLKDEEVFFLTGTDEHGEKIKLTADECNEDTLYFIDRVVNSFKELWNRLNISYDFFIRTTEDFHIRVVQEVISYLFEQGDIYKANYRGFYCIPCESLWTEAQLDNGLCPECKRKVEEITEENYFFRLSK
ncbi:MAG: class I tRNA ligase family protein, partial [Candidatus Omnitrophica bacterium]|nr:class I tRNA ligase family protein [Candidatus Omnitrophota bacterium]